MLLCWKMNQTTERLNFRITTNLWKTLESVKPIYAFPLLLHVFFRVWGIINNKECLKEEKSAKIMVNNKWKKFSQSIDILLYLEKRWQCYQRGKWNKRKDGPIFESADQRWVYLRWKHLSDTSQDRKIWTKL